MADLYLNSASKTQITADEESAKVYTWLTTEIGNKGLPSKIFDSVAFVCHEVANNRLLRNSLTRQVRLRISSNSTQITVSIRYDGEPYNDLDPINGPKGIQGIIALVNAQYGEEIAGDGETTASAGETFYTTNRIIFPITGSK